MNPQLEQILAPIIDALADELRRYGPAFEAAGRELVERLWVAFQAPPQAGGQAIAVPDPGLSGAFSPIWGTVVGPFSQGVADAAEARIRELVAPTVKRIALGTGVAGLAAGWLARGAMSR